MFTGIISDLGRLDGVEQGAMRIVCSYDAAGIGLGASIACDGCCLTVTGVAPGAGGQGAVFTVDVSNETLSRTTLGGWKPGRRVNLERALTLQDELGGHMVTGHVDATAEIIERTTDGASERFVIAAPAALMRFIALKGSIALDGISLTVNAVEGERLAVTLVPHTLAATTWRDKRPGELVNLEVDLVARYVARISDIAQAR